MRFYSRLSTFVSLACVGFCGSINIKYSSASTSSLAQEALSGRRGRYPALVQPAVASGNFTDTVLLKSGETLANVKATVTRDSVIATDAAGNTRVFTKDQVAGVKTGASTSPNANFSDTVMLKTGETLANVKATVTRDQVIVTDANGNTRVLQKEQVAGVKTGGI